MREDPWESISLVKSKKAVQVLSVLSRSCCRYKWSFSALSGFVRVREERKEKEKGMRGKKERYTIY